MNPSFKVSKVRYVVQDPNFKATSSQDGVALTKYLTFHLYWKDFAIAY